MLAEYAPKVANQARGFMILMGYFMALAAFFVTLAQLGGISPSLRVVMYALLAVPIIYVAATTAEAIARGREHT